MRKLATEATFLHPAECHTRIAGAVPINEYPAALKTRRHLRGQRIVGGKDRRRQAKLTVIRQREGVRRIFCDGNGGNRPKSS